VLEAGSEIATTVFIPLDLVYNHYNHTLVLAVDPGGVAFNDLSAPLALSGDVVLVRFVRFRVSVSFSMFHTHGVRR
jgi:hypothetical protein